MYDGRDSNHLEQIDGELLEKYGVKAIIHKFHFKDSDEFDWRITDYFTGMCIFKKNKRKDILSWFESYYNDESLTESGKKDRLERLAEVIKMNTDKYGYANQ